MNKGGIASEKEMSFLDHLEELRWHLIRSVIAIVAAGTIAFIMKDFIFDVLIFGPTKKDTFPTYKLLCEGAKFLGFEGTFCDTEFPFRIQSSECGCFWVQKSCSSRPLSGRTSFCG